MYRCDECNELSKSGEPRNLAIVETRPKKYFDKDGRAAGQGTEIVRCETLCGACNLKRTVPQDTQSKGQQ